MAGSRCAENAILPDYQLLYAICCTNLRNQLDEVRVVESSISCDDEEAALDTLWNREENACDEGLAVVGLLKDASLLPQA